MGCVHIVVMGVAGSGKSTVAKAVADALGVPFLEGDSFHPPHNVEKMRRGMPLNDADRAGWLDAIAAWMRSHPEGVVSCSALKRAYRDRLLAGGGVRFVHLAVPSDVLARRLAAREGHFMPASLLPSQLSELEPLQPDEPGFAVDGTLPLEELVRRITGRR
jgi:gluconokinase